MQRLALAGYDADFARWAEDQAAALRKGRFADLDGVLDQSPSLRRAVLASSASAYPRARRIASSETDLPIATFPEASTRELERTLAAALAGEDFGF